MPASAAAWGSTLLRAPETAPRRVEAAWATTSAPARAAAWEAAWEAAWAVRSATALQPASQPLAEWLVLRLLHLELRTVALLQPTARACARFGFYRRLRSPP